MPSQLVIGARLGAVLALLTGLAACSDGQKASPTSAASTAGATTTTVAPVAVEVTLGTTAIRGAGVPHADPPAIDAATADEVLATVHGYVDTALTGPLAGVEPEWSDLLGPRAAARLELGAHDRGVLTTEGLPEVSAATATLLPVDLVGLTDGFGSLPLVTARVDFTAELETDEGPLTVHHFGELVLGDADGWRIIGYDLIVVRDDRSGPATTTSATVAP